MAKRAQSFGDRVSIAAELVVRSRIFYDIWWFHEGKTSPAIKAQKGRFLEYVRFDAHAHLVALTGHLAFLFEHRPDTINLPGLVEEVVTHRKMPTQSLAKAGKWLKRTKATVRKVTILRSNLFAHRSSSLSYAQAFKKANVTAAEIRRLTETALKVANLLLDATGRAPKHFSELPLEDLKAIMGILAQCTHSEGY